MSFCSELSAKIDTIISLLQEQNVQCCPDGVSYVDPPDYNLDETGNVPQPVIDAGYATGVSDWSGYRAYKCMAAYLMIAAIAKSLRDMQTPFEIGWFLFSMFAGILTGTGLVAGGVIIASPIGTMVVSVGAVIALIEALKDPAITSLLDLADDLEADADAIACYLYNGDGTDDIVQRWYDITESLYSAPEALVLHHMNIVNTVNTFFLGELGGADIAQIAADNGLDTGDFECCQEPVLQLYTPGYGSCVTHTPPVNVAEYEEVQMQSGIYGSTNRCDFMYRATNGTGPLNGSWYFVCTEITGWSAEAGLHERIIIQSQATAPYINGEGATSDWAPSAVPFNVVEGGSIAGFSILSNTSFTMTVKLVRLV